MKEILVDTNVLISFLTDRNPEQQKKAAALFREAAERKHLAVLHSISLIEMVYVLTRLYRAEPSEVADSIKSLLSMPGVATADEVSWDLVLDHWPEPISSLGDAIIASLASQSRFHAVATFDKDLRTKLSQQGSSSYWPG